MTRAAGSAVMSYYLLTAFFLRYDASRQPVCAKSRPAYRRWAAPAGTFDLHIANASDSCVI